jgi:hypothetical protein
MVRDMSARGRHRRRAGGASYAASIMMQTNQEIDALTTPGTSRSSTGHPAIVALVLDAAPHFVCRLIAMPGGACRRHPLDFTARATTSRPGCREIEHLWRPAQGPDLRFIVAATDVPGPHPSAAGVGNAATSAVVLGTSGSSPRRASTPLFFFRAGEDDRVPADPGPRRHMAYGDFVVMQDITSTWAPARSSSSWAGAGAARAPSSAT